MNFTVFGWYDHENCGDEAYKLAFPALFPGHTFTFTDRPQGLRTPLILGGGNVVSDAFLKPLEALPGEKSLLSVGLAGFDQADRLSGLFRHVCVRDPASLDLLRSAGVTAVYLPDFAFALRPDRERGRRLIQRLFQEARADLYGKVVVAVVNAYLAADHEIGGRKYVTFLKAAFDLARVVDGTNASFLFVPFGGGGYANDRVTNAWVAARCKFWKKNAVVYERLGVQDTLDIVSAADAAISSRLHSSIFSTIGGVPFVDLTHHDKNRHYLEAVGRANWSVNYWSLDADRLAALLNVCLADDGTQQAVLSSTADAYRRLLAEQAPALLP